MGKRSQYGESFLNDEQVVRLCRQKQGIWFQAGQVIITQRLMRARKWRQADFVLHSKLKFGQISKVLNVRSFPGTMFWLEVTKAFDLEMDEFDRRVQAWVDAEILRS